MTKNMNKDTNKRMFTIWLPRPADYLKINEETSLKKWSRLTWIFRKPLAPGHALGTISSGHIHSEQKLRSCSSHLPFTNSSFRSQCTNWQRSYRKLHIPRSSGTFPEPHMHYTKTPNYQECWRNQEQTRQGNPCRRSQHLLQWHQDNAYILCDTHRHRSYAIRHAIPGSHEPGHQLDQWNIQRQSNHLIYGHSQMDSKPRQQSVETIQSNQGLPALRMTSGNRPPHAQYHPRGLWFPDWSYHIHIHQTNH